MDEKIRNVRLISIGFFFVFFGFSTAQQYMFIFFHEQGREYAGLLSLLLLYGTFMLSAVAVPKLIPLLGGLKRSLICGAATYALFAASIALNTLPILCIASILAGVGAGLLWISSGQLIADSSDPKNAGRHFGYQTMGLFGGMIAGLYAGAYLLRVMSFAGVCLILAACAVIGILFMLGVRPIREEVEDRVFLPQFIFDRRMLALLPLLLGASFLQGQTVTAMSLVTISFLGTSFLPHIIGLVRFGNMTGSISIGTISDRYAKATVLAVLIGIGLVSLYTFVQVHTLAAFIASALMLGFSMAAIVPVVLAWLNERLPRHEYLYALGVFHTYNTAGFVLAIAANFSLSSAPSFLPAALLLILAVPGIYWFNRQTKH